MAECPNLAKNKAECKCESTYCKRYGVCCECLLYHKKSGGYPACLREK